MLVVGLSGFALLAVGCGEGVNRSELLQRSGFEPDVATLRMPLDSYLPSPREQALVDRAHNILTERCMSAKGFDWEAAAVNLDQDDDTSRNDRLYGIRSPDEARQFGFEGPVPPHVEERKQAAEVQERNTSEAEEVALVGTETKPGCVFQATEEMTDGEGPVDVMLAQVLKGQANESAMSSKAVEDATGAWQRCMQGKGYEGFRSEYELQEANPAWDEPGTPSSEEVQAAVAVVECKKESDYIEVAYREEWTAQLLLIEENAEALEDARTALDNLLRASADVVG